MQKGKVWIYVLIVIGIVIVMGGVWYFFLRNTTATVTNPTNTSAETWTKNKTVLFENVTSSDTHKLDDGTFRMYFQKEGKIVYADSRDATVFGAPLPTGIGDDPGKFISNPAVLKISDGNWIMVYEEQNQQPGQKPGPPGPESQRNLLLATSRDGKTFAKAGIAIDSSKEKDDNFFASVPKLVLNEQGKIRLYYVCGGEAICSAVSDAGTTFAFTKEAGIRMGDKAVDPDVLLDIREGGPPQIDHVMYFAGLTGENNRFYKATSLDGLKWTKGPEVLKPNSEKGAIVDPDVVEIAPDHWRMFFGEMTNGEGQMGGQAQINLYYADFLGNIFK